MYCDRRVTLAVNKCYAAAVCKCGGYAATLLSRTNKQMHLHSQSNVVAKQPTGGAFAPCTVLAVPFKQVAGHETIAVTKLLRHVVFSERDEQTQVLRIARRNHHESRIPDGRIELLLEEPWNLFARISSKHLQIVQFVTSSGSEHEAIVHRLTYDLMVCARATGVGTEPSAQNGWKPILVGKTISVGCVEKGVM